MVDQFNISGVFEISEFEISGLTCIQIPKRKGKNYINCNEEQGHEKMCLMPCEKKTKMLIRLLIISAKSVRLITIFVVHCFDRIILKFLE